MQTRHGKSYDDHCMSDSDDQDCHPVLLKKFKKEKHSALLVGSYFPEI
jgi:hypothetical protein